MNPSLPVAGATRASVADRDTRAAAAAVLCLSRGLPLRQQPEDWAMVFGVALQERCAVLAWARSAAAIRAGAPPGVTARWRAHALERQAYAERQLRVLGATIDCLTADGVSSVVLKGLPLSARLYGDFALRASVDLDIHVPSNQRPQARRTLENAGWTLAEGTPPWTQSFVLAQDGAHYDLELHSSIVDLNLRHLAPPPPQSSAESVGGIVLPVLRDPIEPAYLAAHASKHMPVALLYYIDFHELWASLDSSGQAAARDAARRAGLLGYLDWMVERAAAVDGAAAGDPAALRLLGIHVHGRGDTHAAVRDVMLAASPLAALRSVAAWVWPPNLRDGLMPFLARIRHRVRAPWRKYLAKGGHYRPVGGG